MLLQHPYIHTDGTTSDASVILTMTRRDSDLTQQDEVRVHTVRVHPITIYATHQSPLSSWHATERGPTELQKLDQEEQERTERRPKEQHPKKGLMFPTARRAVGNRSPNGTRRGAARGLRPVQ